MTASDRIREARRAKSSTARAIDADVSIENHGTIVLVRPLVAEAHDWLDASTEGTWFGGALVVEPRYVEALVEGLIEAGFDVSV